MSYEYCVDTIPGTLLDVVGAMNSTLQNWELVAVDPHSDHSEYVVLLLRRPRRKPTTARLQELVTQPLSDDPVAVGHYVVSVRAALRAFLEEDERRD